jgi:hypothetical protein
MFHSRMFVWVVPRKSQPCAAALSLVQQYGEDGYSGWSWHVFNGVCDSKPVCFIANASMTWQVSRMTLKIYIYDR